MSKPHPTLRYSICASRFNEAITKALVKGALDVFRTHGVRKGQVDVLWVPGALELPHAARTLAMNPAIGCVVALGCVIRGDTSHFDVVVRESAHFLARVGHETGKPVLNGVLAVHNLDQALERSRPDSGNKGHEAAQAAVDMMTLKVMRA
ncbi:MAG: 6,7-dimethyl-8-ribityllumazine synthase [Planctomycetota bacterium]